MSNVKFREYHNAGYKVFGLYGIDENGVCGCENPECEALFKHPRIPSWQTIPLWSEEQLHAQETKMSHFEKGFGVLCDDIFVIDVDARNGGLDSFYQLQDDLDIDLEEACNFIVNTGSQDGSMHLYFKAPVPAIALQQTHAKYEGIDFKSSGFVVGLGSTHRSGETYTLKKGSIDDLGEIPQAIIDILKKVAHTRTKYEGGTIDVSDSDLAHIVDHITNDGQDYQKWITIGMAIHDTTMGSNAGFNIWDTWSVNTSGDKYDASEMPKRWDSFGKNSSKATIGTLYHYAKQDGGYVFPVKLGNIDFEVPEVPSDLLDIEHIDIRRPPGVLGELTEWVNNQCLYPRENHAVAAALYIVSALGGMKHKDMHSNMGMNLIMFCVAGSSTGKDSILSAIEDALDYAKVSGAFHSIIKSDAEITRNLLRNQAAYYVIDELGIQLQRIQNAMKRGGASHLEAVFATLMSVYGRSEKSIKMGGDIKEEMREAVGRAIARVTKKLDEPGGGEKEEKELERLMAELVAVDQGLQRPYLHVFGGTTPRTFNGLVDYESATNGFMARAMMFKEEEDNPRWKENFKKEPLSMRLKSVLNNLYWGGYSNDEGGRVEQQGERVPIYTTPEGIEALNEVNEFFWRKAEIAKEDDGLQAIPRRGWEITSKISLALAMADGTDRTLEHVRYGFAIAKADIKRKMDLAYGNDNEKDKDLRGKALVARVSSYLSKDEDMTFGVLRNKMRGVAEKELEAVLEVMKQKKLAIVERRKNARNRDTVYIRGV